MALGSTDIDVETVAIYLGSSARDKEALVGMAGLNKYSFYAPGFLSVDGSKNLVLTPPVDNYLFGDFRRYDKDALTSLPPAENSGSKTAWGPTGTTISFAKTWHPFALNIKAVSGYDDYVTMDFYDSAADRTAQTNRRHRQTFAISYQDITGGALPGHTRNQTQEPEQHQPCNITGFNISGWSGDTTVYMETFISDSSGNRLINLGASRSDGYSTAYFHKRAVPVVLGTSSQDITPRPTGYTHCFPRCYSANTPACSIGNVEHSEGATTYDFYVKVLGIISGGNRIIQVSSCDVILTLNGVSQTVATGIPLGYTSGGITRCTGTLSGGRTWAWDDQAVVTLENVVFPATPLYTSC